MILSIDGLYSVNDVAKLFNERLGNNKVLGQRGLFKIMRKEGWLLSSKQNWNEATQYCINQGYMKLVPFAHMSEDGKVVEMITKVTNKGVEWLWKQLVRKEYIKVGDIA